MNTNKEDTHTKSANENEWRTRVKNTVILIVIIILLVMRCCECLHSVEYQNSIDADSGAVDWIGNQSLVGFGNREDSDKIAIPCFDGLIFKANQSKQKVNIYNPECNTCYMVFSLIVDNATIWKSGNVTPAKGYYEIELIYGLPSGVYNACLMVECYDRNGNHLNNGLSSFTLYVQ